MIPHTTTTREYYLLVLLESVRVLLPHIQYSPVFDVISIVCASNNKIIFTFM